MGMIGEGGKFDEYDSFITQQAKHLGVVVVVLTHQCGNYGRLISECVDARQRSVSYRDLYYL